MTSGTRSSLSDALAVCGALCWLVLATVPASAHVRYVVDGDGTATDPVEFAVQVLSEPTTAALFGGTALLGAVGLLGYLRIRPTIPDLDVLRSTLAGYDDLVPWMLRLSMGLPLVGAGFAGYYFSPAVDGQPRLLLLGLGFLLLFGLATRAVAAAALTAYLVGLARWPDLLLAMEYVPGLLAIVLLGGGRPSADHLLEAVASASGTYYGRIDPVHRVADRFRTLIEPYTRYAPTVVRVGLGVVFVYLGLVEKLLHPGRTLDVVLKYDLTAVIPVDPGAWVLGAGLAEITLGLLLLAGLLTRGVAAAAFVVFTLTLFGIPDDPILAHVTMFGLASAAFTMGSGPLALDRVLADADSEVDRPAPGQQGLADD
ncbi:MAG: DoxX family membrane protein [Halorientalis sp.]